MTYYSYKPTDDGREPMGTSDRHLRYDLKTDAGAIRDAVRLLGPTARVFRVAGSFYDEKSHQQIR